MSTKVKIAHTLKMLSGGGNVNVITVTTLSKIYRCETGKRYEPRYDRPRDQQTPWVKILRVVDEGRVATVNSSGRKSTSTIYNFVRGYKVEIQDLEPVVARIEEAPTSEPGIPARLASIEAKLDRLIELWS